MTFRSRGKTIDVREVRRQLGVRCVLEGSIRRAGDRVRANAKLIEAASGAHLWAERNDREVAMYSWTRTRSVARSSQCFQVTRTWRTWSAPC